MGRSIGISLVVLIGLASPGVQAGSHSVLALHGHHGHPYGGYGAGPRNFGGGGYGYGGYGYGGYGVPVFYGVPYAVGGYGPGLGYGGGFGGQFAPVPFAAVNPVAAMTPVRSVSTTTARTKRPDTSFAAETLTLGDRLFRAGNLTKAVERYEQSIKADPSKAAPSGEAWPRWRWSGASITTPPNWLREADTVDPTLSPDQRRRHPTPSTSNRATSRSRSPSSRRTSSRIPEDRDAWLLLGAEHYFSGRTRRGRRHLPPPDRPPGRAGTLSAFLSASKARDEPVNRGRIDP